MSESYSLEDANDPGLWYKTAAQGVDVPFDPSVSAVYQEDEQAGQAPYRRSRSEKLTAPGDNTSHALADRRGSSKLSRAWNGKPLRRPAGRAGLQA